MHDKVNPALRDANEVATLREDFDYFDRNDDGRMDLEEFTRFLTAVGADMSELECGLGFREVDTDRDGVIEFEEFLDWWT